MESAIPIAQLDIGKEIIYYSSLKSEHVQNATVTALHVIQALQVHVIHANLVCF